MLDRLAQEAGKKFSDADLAKMAEGCRNKSPRDKLVDCVLGTKDDAAVSACWSRAFAEYRDATKNAGYTTELGVLGLHAQRAYERDGRFPIGKVGPTPKGPCCTQPDHECATTDSDWGDPVWKALDFMQFDSVALELGYESDGTTFTATGTGDRDCDGHPKTFTITGTIVGGKVVVTDPR